MEKRTNACQLQIGDYLSRISYVQIVGKTRSGGLRIQNQEGLVWTIGQSIVENEMYSAGQYTEEHAVSRTEMIKALESAGDSIFTVIFDKKVNQKTIATALMDLKELPTKKTHANKMAKSMMIGQERTLVGYLASTEPKMGRSTVVDLEVDPDKHNLRLVDHRTVRELILQNTRYVLKK